MLFSVGQRYSCRHPTDARCPAKLSGKASHDRKLPKTTDKLNRPKLHDKLGNPNRPKTTDKLKSTDTNDS